MLTIGSLFSGAGGFDLGFHAAGFRTAWMAEWDDSPRAILRAHWPDVPLYGDVRALCGRTLTLSHGPVDGLIGGSPRQDLSVAGKRAGINGERSRLFHEQIRIWDELGCDWMLWENVNGARWTNAGADFGIVLGAFVGAAVPVPSDGWRSAGVVAGPRGLAAWRVLDAQFFGVPQRRRRVFVVGTRTGSIDPAEILSLTEGMCGDSPARGQTRERVADSLTVGANQTCGFPGDVVANDDGDGDGIAPTLTGNGDGHSGFRDADGLVLAFDTTQITSKTNRSRPRAGDPCHPLAAQAHPPAICVTGEQTHALTHDGADASEDGMGRGTQIVFGFQRSDSYAPETRVASCLGASEAKQYKDTVVGTMNGLRAWSAQTATDGYIRADAGVPRRLTPRECERLMGWPDDWTKPAGSDSARYHICGNGVVANVAQWIAERIAAQLTDGAA